MRLGARFALALGALAAIAVAVASVAAIAVARRELATEVDRTLSEYATRISFADPRQIAILCGAEVLDDEGGNRDDRDSDDRSDDADDDRSDDGDDRSGSDDPPDPRDDDALRELPGSAVQCLTPTGRVFGDERFPVDDGDRALARGEDPTSGGRITTARSGDTTFRVLTVPLSGGGAVQVARELTESRRALGGLGGWLAVVALATITAASLAGLWFARRTTRPLEDLTAAAERIATSGDLAVPVAASGEDEVGRLGRAFGGMLDALRRSRDQQRRLAQDAGHELRTPLTSLRTNIDTLRRHADLDPATRDRILEDLDLEARELSALTDELLALVTDTSDAEAATAVDLGALVTELAGRVARRGDRGIAVVASGDAHVLAPRSRLARAIGNLLDNAAKFSPPDAPIEVTQRGGRVVVRDRGPGIAPADLPHVFDRFWRAETARALPGSGLGLAIVAQIAADLGGTVSAGNAPDGGAVFTLDVPTVAPPSAG